MWLMFSIRPMGNCVNWTWVEKKTLWIDDRPRTLGVYVHIMFGMSYHPPKMAVGIIPSGSIWLFDIGPKLDNWTQDKMSVHKHKYLNN